MGAVATAGAEHKIKQAQINAARTTQKSGNERSGAESELARFSQSLGNRRAMDAGGDRINAIGENIGRNLDAATYGTVMQKIGAAEELGAHTAMAAAAGVGGSSVDAYAATLRLNQAMQQEQQDRALNSELLDASKQRGIQLTDTVAGLDNNVIAANLDMRVYADHKKMSTFTAIAGTVATAAATYFGGPQAGQAVQNLMMADYQASNGDFAGSSRSLGASLSMGKQGFDSYRAGGAWGKSVANKVGATLKI